MVHMRRAIAGRTMDNQGRGLFSLLLRHLPDVDTRVVRAGEFPWDSLIGFPFGDGHPHDKDLITPVTRT
ncbi:DUF3556 domain-containing protein [Streptomyces sp. HG99]